MNASTTDATLAVLLPCLIFMLSIWRINEQALKARINNGLDVIWTGTFVIINVISCFWGSTVISALQATGGIPVTLAEQTRTTGAGFFVTLLVILFARPAWAGLLSGAQAAESLLKASLKVCVKKATSGARRKK